MSIGNKRRIIIFVFVLVASIVLQMCLHYKVFKPIRSNKVSDNQDGNMDKSYIAGLYYSNWSPYEPRYHFPHDIDLEKISHIYYAFFTIDSSSGKIKSSDTWSDFEMNLGPQCREFMLNKFEGDELKTIANIKMPNGCIGELNYLRLVYNKIKNRNIRLIMSVGGWSNREEFPKIVRDSSKLDQFIDSCIDQMITYGFDGIDLDWEFPEDDGYEPLKYLEMVTRLKQRMLDVEQQIYGKDSNNRFQLSMATPAFNQKLSILPLKKMDKYIDYWNMMTYDYYGEWSEYTGLHSNLYDGKGTGNHKHRRSEDDEGLNADQAIEYMKEKVGIAPEKIVLGIAAYGRGFTNVETGGYKEPENPYGLKFSGVGGASEGEPGMWLYNQLPIKGSEERYKVEYGSAFCFDPKTRTLVGYDNTDSVTQKAMYITDNNLAGAFWWESCGDTHSKKPERSLITAYRNAVGGIKNNKPSPFFDTEFHEYYLNKFDKTGFLYHFIENIIQEK